MGELQKILLFTDSDRVANLWKDYLFNRYTITKSESFNQVEDLSLSSNYEYIICDFLLLNEFNPNLNSEAFYQNKIEQIRASFPSAAILVLIDSRKLERAGVLLNSGFDNLIPWPTSKEYIFKIFDTEKKKSILQQTLVQAVPKVERVKEVFQTTNLKFQQDLQSLEKVAKSKSTILITGESGTGKSLLARHIHEMSDRSQKPFISVHCGAIPENLVESELFGHEKGSFTGAIKRKIGKFELANSGTLFLDEIGTIGASTQIKLLQALQERFIQRVGGESDIPLDIRIIAATNDNLSKLVEKKTFREDLFFRIKVFSLEIPPLRDRKEDIPLIGKNILKKLNLLYGYNIESISDEVLSIFNQYHWPGNIRELENILERSYILEKYNEITPTTIPKDLLPSTKIINEISPLYRKNISLAEARKEVTNSFEIKYLTDLLIAHQGRINHMAQEAEVTPRQLHKLMAKHNIKSKQFSLNIQQDQDLV